MIQLLVSLLFTLNAGASDHIDGPITTEHAASDISDFFAFKKDGDLVMVMNLYPAAPTDAHFETRLIYSMIVRAASLEGASTATTEDTELRINCRFEEPHRSRGTVTCQSTNGQVDITGKVQSVIEQSGIKLYSGLRSDPFIFNGKFAKSIVENSQIPTQKGGNDMEQLNVLSIVIQLPKSVLPATDLLATATEVSFQEAGSTAAPEQLDRVGRPEITNVTMDVKGEGEEDYRDGYNALPTFGLTVEEKEIFKNRIAANIIAYDQIDNQENWTEKDAQKAASLLVEDYLLVSLDNDCAETGNFLKMEKDLLQGKTPSSCGGRFLEDDIMDDIFTWYISKDTKRYEDNAFTPYRQLSEFPYLGKPDTSFSARAKAWIARNFLL